MQTVDNQLTQPEFTPPAENQLAEAGTPFSFTRRQVVLIGVVGLVLLLIFGLGIRAGEKRATKKQLPPKTQLTPTKTPPTLLSPTPTPPTVTPAPTTKLPPASSEEHRPVGPKTVTPVETKEEKEPPKTCRDRFDCIRCIGFNEICETGECINGVCVWPT